MNSLFDEGWNNYILVIMKKIISKWLCCIADKISPIEGLSDIERIDHYEARELGICLVRDEKEIKKYREANNICKGWSNRKSDEMLIKEVKD